MNKDDNNELVISFLKIRRIIGIAGIALPFLCVLINYLFINFNVLNNPLFVKREWSVNYISSLYFKPTISDYYFTLSSVIFTGILITVSIFLFCYHGYREKPKEDKFPFLTDNLMTNIAAISLLGVALLPTSSKNQIADNIYVFHPSDLIGGVHLTCAAIFFVSISVMCIVNFRRTGKSKEFGTETNDKIYLLCGLGMLLMIVLMIVYKFLNQNLSSVVPDNTIFWLETVALILFGTAWLVKGKVYGK